MPIRTWIKPGEKCYVLGEHLGLLKDCWYTCLVLKLHYKPPVKEINLFGEEQKIEKAQALVKIRIARTITDLDGKARDWQWEQTISVDKIKREPY